MQVATNLSTVTNLTSAELKDALKSQPEAEFVLIDVRQAEEYLEGHIPGARLMPLNELGAFASELKQLADRKLIFYCRGGGRSARASAWASEAMRLPSVYNLIGGFMGWQGAALVGFPRIASFDLRAPVETQLRRALELEKGTHRLYELIASEYPSGIVGTTFAGLVHAELAHGRTLYEQLKQRDPGITQSFDELFASIPSSLIENGQAVDVVLSQARELREEGDFALLELAAEIELGAYDLYKNLATLIESKEAADALEGLAQQEKAHSDMVLRALGSLAKERGSSRS